ncbi:MAG: LacI family transcriptional regulator [Clostridiales bacterium]|jgi:LacI family transcriptional regulator|nr:LacI family transcriptional regulator [Clostridiales bacterium]
MGRITMKDVANKAGVSVATVSNVLNNVNKKTTEETRVKVMSVVDELNYKLDMTARALSSGKSNLVGVFFAKHIIDGKKVPLLKENPFYSEALSGIENRLSEKGYQLLVASIDDKDEALDLIRRRMLDAVVIFGMRSDYLWSTIKKSGVPLVSIDAHNDQASVNVEMDNEYAGYIATKHLIELGHKKIAFCSKYTDVSELIGGRYKGFLRAIKEGNLNVEDCPIVESEINIEGGEDAGRLLLEKYSDITAVFTSADIIAFGIIKYYQANGKSVPDDLSVVGFDNLAACEYIHPGVTTIKQDIYEKGIKAADILVDLAQGIEVEKNYVLPVELIIRESTKKYEK